MAKCSKMAKLPSAGFEDMPDEIILQIFKHLEFYDNASSSQVCKRWKLLSEDQSLWQIYRKSFETWMSVSQSSWNQN